MLEHKTHREVRSPQVSARYLADYMAASETAKRTIIRSCKFQPIARVIQHDEARLSVGKFIRAGRHDTELPLTDARRLRERMADTPFDRDLFDHNADYIERFVAVAANLQLPDAEILSPGRNPPVDLRGVKITVDISFRLRRLTRTNDIRVGAGTLRYAKGTCLPPAVAAWQSAFLFGYLNLLDTEPSAPPEHKLCLTVDVYGGIAYQAPSDSVRRFQNMEAACATIAERWPNIPPPPDAAL